MAKATQKVARVLSAVAVSHHGNIAVVIRDSIHGGKNVASGKMVNVGLKVTYKLKRIDIVYRLFFSSYLHV